MRNHLSLISGAFSILTVSLGLYTAVSLSQNSGSGKARASQTARKDYRLPDGIGANKNTGALILTGVAANTDSVKVRYSPVAGAADYRIYDSNDPRIVKYAGIWHLIAPAGYHFKTDGKGHSLVPEQAVPNAAGVTTPTEVNVPATEIEMNGLTPGKTYTLVIEAVDAIGPASQGCLYNNKNVASFTRLCDLSLLGSNMGCTGDGKMTTNGQGAKDNRPKKIASATARVTPTGRMALPSSRVASQILFDTFDHGVIKPIGKAEIRTGIERFTLRTPAANWEIRTENADTLHSEIFVMNKHFMDVLFDGGTPGSNIPMHVGLGVLSLSPTQTADFSGGRILHITEEVDAHLGSRRWIDFRLAPAHDPYLFFETNGRINHTNTDLMVQVFGSNVTVDEHLGDRNHGDAHSPPVGISVVGAAGQATFADSVRPRLTMTGSLSAYGGMKPGVQQGRGLDDRSRFDLFVSQTHFAFYEDGIKVSEHDLPKPLPFAAAKVYFSHYHYHSGLEIQELGLYAPWESFWLTTFPFSDERHWDNMGFEVLPAAADWAGLSGAVQPAAFR